MRGAEALLLDEMFAPVLAQRLCAEGFDVVSAAWHASLASASDEEVMQWAVAQDRRLVTENVKDFQPLIQRAGEADEPAARVLYTSRRRFPRTRHNPSPLLDALRQWLAQPSGHASPIAWLS